jgi:hypothetical protein
MATTNSLYFDTKYGFSPTNFRNSFHNGIGRPSLFVFRIKRYPKIYTSPSFSGPNLLRTTIPNALGVSPFQKDLIQEGQSLYDSVTSSGLSELQFRIDKFTLPDKSLGVYTTKTYGPSSDFPRDIENGSMSMSVLCGGDYYEHDFFQTWIDSALTYSGTKPPTDPQKLVSTVLSTLGLPGNTSNLTKFDVAYYDDIITDAELVVYDEEGNATYIITFEDVYPKVVGGIGFDWNAKNEISTFNLTLHYRIMTGSKVLLSTNQISKAISKIF